MEASRASVDTRVTRMLHLHMLLMPETLLLRHISHNSRWSLSKRAGDQREAQRKHLSPQQAQHIQRL